MKTLNVDQRDWGQIKVTGEDRVRFLQGMCTSNVASLADGDWLRTCILNAKGRVMSVVDVVKRPDHLILICQPGQADATTTLLSKYAIADDVAFENVQQPLHRVWGAPSSVWTAPPIFEPPPEPVADPALVEVRRIEGGLPTYGKDVSDEYFPFETPLDRLIDHAKGCYIGQEPVARVNARGSAQKTLRGLAIEGDGAVAVGAQVAHESRANAGTVTSAAVSGAFGSVALAYLHRSVWEPGTSVTVAGRAATVVELPFESH